MIKLTATPMFGKTLIIIFFETDWPILLKLGIQHCAFKYYQVSSNDDPMLTFVWEND